MKSLLTILSPTEVWSKTSVTAVLTPDLVSTPVSLTSLNVSWTIFASTVPAIDRPHPIPNHPAVGIVVCIVLTLAVSTISVPVQFCTQEFQTVGANPVWGSTFDVLAAFARVSA